MVEVWWSARSHRHSFHRFQQRQELKLEGKDFVLHLDVPTLVELSQHQQQGQAGGEGRNSNIDAGGAGGAAEGAGAGTSSGGGGGDKGQEDAGRQQQQQAEERSKAKAEAPEAPDAALAAAGTAAVPAPAAAAAAASAAAPATPVVLVVESSEVTAASPAGRPVSSCGTGGGASPSPSASPSTPSSHKRARPVEGASDSAPAYRGVRQRSWGKWVSEIREPKKKSRIWLGSFSSPHVAARAYDVAALCLKGSDALLNFPETRPTLPRPASGSPKDIQAAATAYALQGDWDCCPDSREPAPADEGAVTRQQQQQAEPQRQEQGHCAIEQAQQQEREAAAAVQQTRKEEEEQSCFMDEDLIFDMHNVLRGMAEAMLLEPPASPSLAPEPVWEVPSLWSDW